MQVKARVAQRIITTTTAISISSIIIITIRMMMQQPDIGKVLYHQLDFDNIEN
jgi:hypothetical protein